MEGPQVQARVRRLRPTVRPRTLFFLAAQSSVVLGSVDVWAADPVSEQNEKPETKVDDFDLSARASTNLRVFEADRAPGVAGTPLEYRVEAPFHQSVSVQAARVDSPLGGEDSLQMQVAAYGLLTAGGFEDQSRATWDVASAFIQQDFDQTRIVLGRQVIAGGAARYTRMDGVQLGGTLPFGLDLSAYGGFSTLPRWDGNYGYYSLGDAYEEWSRDPLDSPERSENMTGGARLHWANADLGALGVSFHHQSENEAIYQQSLGVSGALYAVDKLEVAADLLYSIQSERVSEARIFADFDAYQNAQKNTALLVRAEFFHTVPALLLSQGSIFSVFTQSEVTEVGGEVTASLPMRFRVGLSGYGQMYAEGEPGLRSDFSARYAFDEEGSAVIRAVLGRVSTDENGYVSARLAGSVKLPYDLFASSDLYFYRYDKAVVSKFAPEGGETFRASSFYSAYLGYASGRGLSARVGGSVARTPYASVDARVLARLTVEWDRRSQRSSSRSLGATFQ